MNSTAIEIVNFLENIDSKHYIELLDLSPGIVIIKDNSDKIVWANQAACELVGFKNKNRLIGQSPSDLLDFIPKDKYALIDKDIISTKEAKLNMVEVVNTPIKKDQIFRIDKIPFINKVTGECIGIITYVINISSSIQEKLKEYIDDIHYQSLRADCQRIISALK